MPLDLQDNCEQMRLHYIPSQPLSPKPRCTVAHSLLKSIMSLSSTVTPLYSIVVTPQQSVRRPRCAHTLHPLRSCPPSILRRTQRHALDYVQLTSFISHTTVSCLDSLSHDNFVDKRPNGHTLEELDRPHRQARKASALEMQRTRVSPLTIESPIPPTSSAMYRDFLCEFVHKSHHERILVP